MEAIAISKFKATCLAVLERVRRTGEPILVTRRGAPVAQVLPPPEPDAAETSAFGCMKSSVEIEGDIVEPLPSEVWEAMK